ncbi:hypothetical protein [Roseivirga spongicola]|uniref:hypothetical protein n=1 Tax=Roseivirga spongicola TaxID=333140 RepID=UPI002AC89517|nr:hypothetical protein [Roseivirga spongicola]WPZ10262.1 hypothetical protein T7867_18520 [Roseivirga spongicola]
MFRITLDIEQHYNTLLENNQGYLRALAFLQYPIYCIHATILDSTPDELEILDKAILDLVKDNPTDANSISTILGVSKRAIENRIIKLENEELVENGKSITTKGRLFITEGSEKRYSRKDIDIYLDGTNNRPVSKNLAWYYSSHFISEEYYNFFTKDDGQVIIQRPFAPDLVHEPISEEKIKTSIESLNEDQKSRFGIPIGLEKIESMSYTLLTLPLLVSLSDDGKPVKQITNGLSLSGENEPITEIKKILEAKIQGLLVQLNPSKNHGPTIGTNWFEADNNDFGNNRLFYITEDEFKEFIEIEYSLTGLENENIICDKNELVLVITKKLLDRTRDKKSIIINLLRGRDYISRNPLHGVWKLFITFKTTDVLVQEICELYALCKEYDFSPPLEEVLTMKNNMKGNFRKNLIDLELNGILEKIDMKLFMNDPSEA